MNRNRNVSTIMMAQRPRKTGQKGKVFVPKLKLDHDVYRRQKRQCSLPVLFLLFLLSFSMTWSSLFVLLYRNNESRPILPKSSTVAKKNESYYKSLPAQVFLTTYGWNHPDPRIATQTGRSKFQASFHRGIENHPWYNPLGWQHQIEYSTKGTYNDQRFYVFLDLETCYEENFPNYGWGVTANSDQEHGRPYLSSSGGQIRAMKTICPMIDQLLDSSLFQAAGRNSSTILVLLDCGWQGPPKWSCLNREHNPRLNQHQVSIVSESASYQDRSRSILDLGLPPPAIHSVSLTADQNNDIRMECPNDKFESRPYLYTFTGNFRHVVRQQLLQLHNPDAGILVQPHFGNSAAVAMNDTLFNVVGRGVHDRFANVQGSYTTLLSQTQFAGVPRGDNLFSYRFTEALSGGCIPVVYADGWVLPFSKRLLDWHSVAILIPEQDVAQTMNYLQNVSMKERCRMRQKGYEFYQQYMATPEGVVAGIVESLELWRNITTLQ